MLVGFLKRGERRLRLCAGFIERRLRRYNVLTLKIGLVIFCGIGGALSAYLLVNAWTADASSYPLPVMQIPPMLEKMLDTVFVYPTDSLPLKQ